MYAGQYLTHVPPQTPKCVLIGFQVEEWSCFLPTESQMLVTLTVYTLLVVARRPK